MITSKPIILYPDYEKVFTLTTDASNLLEPTVQLICFASRTLNEHELHCSNVNFELWCEQPTIFARTSLVRNF